MFIINFLLDCARGARGARTAQSSKKMMTNLSENGYIHEFGFNAGHMTRKIGPLYFNQNKSLESSINYWVSWLEVDSQL